MQVVGKINNLHEDTLPKRLEPGQEVRYQLLMSNPNPDVEARKKRPVVFPASWQIPARNRIYDPNKKDYVDIALFSSVDDKGNLTLKEIFFRGIEHGEIRCVGGDYEGEELYEYLELHNENESNPNRNKNVIPTFKRIDDAKDSEKMIKETDELLTALNYIAGMTVGEIKDKAASLGWDENLSPKILKARLQEWAKKEPAKFLKTVGSKEEEVKATIKKALSANVIGYDTAQHKIVYGNQTLIKLDRAEGVDYLTQAADYILHHKNGDKVYKTIKQATNSGNAGEQPA